MNRTTKEKATQILAASEVQREILPVQAITKATLETNTFSGEGYPSES